MAKKENLLKPDTILNGRYEINSLIKTGGMGSVYKARDLLLEKSPCAVKEMLQPLGDKEEQEYRIKRFQREVKILSELKHPNLPVIKDSFIEDNRYYLVMYYVKGKDLETIMESYGGRGVPEGFVIDWARQILSALDYLHNQDPPVIYRDLKPENVMIRDSDKQVILIDFGLARKINPLSDRTMTAIGTPGYAPQELFQGKPELRVDIYSLGATMHSLLTGQKPVNLFGFKSVREINPSVTEDLDKIVMKALANHPKDRYKNTKEMKEALDRLKEKTKTVIMPVEKRKNKKIQIRKEPEKKNFFKNLIPFFNSPGKAEKKYKEGEKAYSEGNYGNAIELYNKVINLEPMFFEAWHKKGKALYSMKKYNEAIVCYDKTLEINEEHGEAFMEKGIIMVELNDYDGAIKNFDRAIELERNNIEALNYKVYSLYKKGNYEEAIRLSEKVLNLDQGDFIALYNKGMILEKEGKDMAKDFYKKALEKTEDYLKKSSKEGEKLYLARKYKNKCLERLKKGND